MANNAYQSDIELIEFDAADARITWEESHEVEVEGKYYDVVKQQYVNGRTTLYCIADDDETLLYDWYKNVAAKSKEKDVDKTIVLETTALPNQKLSIIYTPVCLQTIYTVYNRLQSHNIPVPLSPPPKIVVV